MNGIDKIRAELAAATPGPWRSVSTPYHWELQECRSNITIVRVHRGHGTPPPESHATLIAHAPTYLAALLDVAEAAREACESFDAHTTNRIRREHVIALRAALARIENL